MTTISGLSTSATMRLAVGSAAGDRLKAGESKGSAFEATVDAAIAGDRSKPVETKSMEASASGGAKTGVPGDRSKPGETKGMASTAVEGKTGTPGDRLKPGESKAGIGIEQAVTGQAASSSESAGDRLKQDEDKALPLIGLLPGSIVDGYV